MRIFRKCVENTQFLLKSDMNEVYFTRRPIDNFSTSRSFLTRMRNVLDKSCRENRNAHFVFSNFFSPENRAVYEIMCENVVEGATDDNMPHAF